MRNLFPEFRQLASRELRRVWRDTLFVFDTSVLLNLYRYQASAREELIGVLGELAPRIWIPHHVALEFHRNRLTVIAAQNRRFLEVRRTVEAARDGLNEKLGKLDLRKRHALIDPERLTVGFASLVDQFLEELSRLQESQQKVTAPDPIKAELERLFDGRVGAAPENQEVLNRAYKEAEWRHARRIPPGFLDDAKGGEEVSEYLHGGLVYDRRYGDFLIWQQLLEHAKTIDAKRVAFVTDDSKEDWWLKIDSDGPKTIGARPELIEEARRTAGIESFSLHSPEGFLKLSNQYQQARVSEETLQEVREISSARSQRQRVEARARQAALAESAVLAWLRRSFGEVQFNERGPVDFFVQSQGRRIAVDVRLMPRSPILFSDLFHRVQRIAEGFGEEFDEVWLVFVAENIKHLTDMHHRLQRIAESVLQQPKFSVVVGVLAEVGEAVEFVETDRLSAN